MRTFFFILAGGYGKRAKPLSLVKPKPLFPLDGTPLIKIMLNQLNEKGLRRGFVNLHYLPEAFRQYVRETRDIPGITWLYEEKLSGSQILKGALGDMNGDDLLLATNGDIFLEIPIEAMLKEIKTSDADGVLLVRKKDENSKYTSILSEDGLFIGTEKYNGKPSYSESLMYTGVALLKKNIIRKIEHINFFDTLANHNFKIKVSLYDGIWLDIGNPASYMESNLKYKRYKDNGDPASNSLSENVSISADSVVKHSIIWENTEIKNKSVIAHCIVTGNITLDHAHFENEIIISEVDSHRI